MAKVKVKLPFYDAREDVERAAGETFVASDERAAELLANLPAGYVEIEKPRRRTRKAKEQ